MEATRTPEGKSMSIVVMVFSGEYDMSNKAAIRVELIERQT